MPRIFSITPLVVLASCAATPQTSNETGEPARITYSTEVCFGFCPAFTVAVTRDGEGRYEGRNFVAQRGEREFGLTEAEFIAFRDALSTVRPAESVAYNWDNCDGDLVTDMPSIHIAWEDENGATTELNWYQGCRQPEMVAHEAALSRAWQLLPIGELVGSDEDRMNYRNP